MSTELRRALLYEVEPALLDSRIAALRALLEGAGVPVPTPPLPSWATQPMLPTLPTPPPPASLVTPAEHAFVRGRGSLAGGAPAPSMPPKQSSVSDTGGAARFAAWND
jgi:hypothetical protein